MKSKRVEKLIKNMNNITDKKLKLLVEIAELEVEYNIEKLFCENNCNDILNKMDEKERIFLKLI
jgi:hypothetical protein